MLVRQKEKVFHRLVQCSSEPEHKDRRGNEHAVLDRVDRLSRDTHPDGEIGLRQPLPRSLLFEAITQFGWIQCYRRLRYASVITETSTPADKVMCASDRAVMAVKYPAM